MPNNSILRTFTGEMSRTEGVTLPRLPRQHARATSSRAIQPHAASSGAGGPDCRRRTASEPNYTAFVGSPRQDVPMHVYRDAAMYDDVFDKKGELLQDRNVSKIESPLKTLGYSSLHDVHCRKLFLKNKHVKSHLVNLGLITADLKVVATTTEQRQKIRAHELLERREQLQQKLESKEHRRIERLVKLPALPSTYLANLKRAEEREERARVIAAKKVEKKVKEMEKSLQNQRLKYEEDQNRLVQAMEQAALIDQARRNAAHAHREIAETAAYSKRYGMYGYEMASWYRDSDLIHNRMIALERKGWPQKQDKSGAFMGNTEGMLSSDVPVLPSITQTPPVAASPPIPVDEGIPKPLATPPIESQELTEAPPSTSDEVTSPAPKESQMENEVFDAEVPSPEIPLTISTPPPPVETGSQIPAENIEQPEATPTSALSQSDTADDTDGADAKPMESSATTESESVTVDTQILDADDAFAELIQILVDIFVREDLNRNGFIPVERFVNVLGSRRLGLQLSEEEIQYLVNMFNISGNDHIQFIQAVPELPQHLIMIYRNRAESAINTYGLYAEDEWCEIIAIKKQPDVVYFNKLSGIMVIGAKPDDFRPYMKDEAFEDAIVDFFEMADTDKNGIINYEDFYALLVSPMVSTRVYRNQIEQLLELFVQTYNQDGLVNLEMFLPLARILLLMIYQNTYLNEEEWIELESRKMGRFYFNKSTGETYLPASEGDLPPGVTTEAKIKPRKRKKKTSRNVSWSDLSAPRNSQTGPPPLIKKSKDVSSQEEEETTRTDESSDN